MPGRKQAWPIAAACWSPAIPAIGIAVPNSPASVLPKSPSVSRISGSSRRGMPKASSSSSSQVRRLRSNSIVREALVTSVACSRPPLRRHKRKLSIVPNAISPARARSPRPGIVSSSQRILDAEKYGSMTRPVRSATISSRPASRHRAQISAVRRSCQTMALCTRRPVARSHSTVVSRWLVMPIAAIGRPSAPAIAARQVETTACQISSGSCSTQPGRG